MRTYTISFNYGTNNRKTIQIDAIDQLTAIACACNTEGEESNWCDTNGFWLSCTLADDKK